MTRGHSIFRASPRPALSILTIFSSTSPGRFGLGDSTPEAFFEIASSTGITASISNIFAVDAGNSRITVSGTGSSSFSGSLTITKSLTAGNAFYGASLTDCDTATTSKLLWNDSNGTFSCGTDRDTLSTGLAMEVSGVTSKHITDLKYDSGAFNFTTTSSTGTLYLDYANGPASRSIDQTITGFWEFQKGASFSNDVEFRNNNAGSIFAIFASTSLGRFSLGDSTPEAFFEIASSTGVTASISNIFFVNAGIG